MNGSVIPQVSEHDGLVRIEVEGEQPVDLPGLIVCQRAAKLRAGCDEFRQYGDGVSVGCDWIDPSVYLLPGKPMIVIDIYNYAGRLFAMGCAVDALALASDVVTAEIDDASDWLDADDMVIVRVAE